jgi:hypothetical protein
MSNKLFLQLVNSRFDARTARAASNNARGGKVRKPLCEAHVSQGASAASSPRAWSDRGRQKLKDSSVLSVKQQDKSLTTVVGQRNRAADANLKP